MDLGLVHRHALTTETLITPAEDEDCQKDLETELQEYPELQTIVAAEMEDTDSDIEPDVMEDLEDLAYAEPPEKTVIWLPHRDPDALTIMHDYELQLQSAHALDQIQIIQHAIGDKSLYIQILIRRNRKAGQKRKGRTWAAVNKAHATLFEAWATYERARIAIDKLPLTEAVKDWKKKLLPIKKEDLKNVNDVTHANRYNQKLHTLPWFWHMHEGQHDEATLMKESKSLRVCILYVVD